MDLRGQQSATRTIELETVTSSTVLDFKKDIDNFSLGNINSILNGDGIEGITNTHTLSKRNRNRGTVNLENARPFCETKAPLIRWAKSANTFI